MIQFMQQNGIVYNKIEDNGCKMELMHNGVQQGDGCEETEGRNREMVDTRETNPSTGSKQSDYQH